jgi:hypothetical protein
MAGGAGFGRWCLRIHTAPSLTTIAAQPAGKPKVKKAKRKIEAGLTAVIASYRLLSTAIGEDASNPEAAKAETTKAEAAVKKGRTELLEGVKLLA